MEGYYLYKVVPPILGFIDDLTEWYIRRSRRRFGVLLMTLRVRWIKPLLMRPFTKHGYIRSGDGTRIALHHRVSLQNLVIEPVLDAPDSVHLCDYPQVDASKIDTQLEVQVEVVRKVVSMGRALRETPPQDTPALRRVTIVHHDSAILAAVDSLSSCEELSERVLARSDDTDLAELSFKANFKTLGRRLGKRMKEAAQAIGQLSLNEWQTLQTGGHIVVADEQITSEDIIVNQLARGDVVIEVDGGLTVLSIMF